MIRGFVDMLCVNFASGWCADSDQPEKKLEVTAWYKGQPLASTVADQAREDLLRFGDEGKFAFRIDFSSPLDPALVEIVATSRQDRQRLPVIKIDGLKRGYQTFDDQLGDSNSREKLERLRIFHRLDGMSVLDLGCNEGFFCLDALSRGATRVVGIDSNADFIHKARQRSGDVEYIHGNWWNMPDEKFDLIYLLSAIHYEKEQKKFLDKIAEHLTERGTLILECGMVTSVEGQAWVSVRRGDGTFRYPTRDMLFDSLLRNYYVRVIDCSVDQPGDPVKRYVFHCTVKKPVCIFVKGAPYAGKTIVASILAASRETARFSIDSWIGYIQMGEYAQPENNPIYKKIVSDCDLNFINKFINALSPAEAQAFAEAAFSALPLDNPCLILEGYALNRNDISGRLDELLAARNIRTWTLNPGNRPW